jgi:hypothetical protein
LEEGLHTVREVEETRSEKRTDGAKRLGLPPPTIHSIIAKKGEVIQEADDCGTSAKKKNTGNESTYSKLKISSCTRRLEH